MRINNNLMAMNTHRQFAINTDNVSKATEKLSSGYRINRAGDDAAGLAISEKMRAQIRGLNMASKNSQDAISLIQTAEGALTETHAILQRMRELATQSASDTNQNLVDRAALQDEFEALQDEIDDIATQTKFNEMQLLNGSFGAVATVDAASEIAVGVGGITNISLQGFSVGNNQTITFARPGVAGTAYTATFGSVQLSGVSNAGGAQSISLDFGGGRTALITMSSAAAADQFAVAGMDVLTFDVTGTQATIQTGANASDTMDIAIGDMSSAALLVDKATIQIDSRANASTALTSVNTAINSVSTQRSELGAYQNRLQHKINNLDTSAENLQAAESRIRDLDMAKEMTNFTKNNILVQAATAMLAQANSAPQGVLQLLK